MAANRKLVVEVVDARNIAPKDGQGSSSPYVVIDYYGQRRRTQTIVRDLNPAWNETLEFSLAKRHTQVFTDVLELDMYHDKNFGPTRRHNFLGRIRLGSNHFVGKGEEALIYYPLEKKNLFNPVQGEIGLRIYYADDVVQPPALLEPVAEETPPTVPNVDPPANPPVVEATPSEPKQEADSTPLVEKPVEPSANGPKPNEEPAAEPAENVTAESENSAGGDVDSKPEPTEDQGDLEPAPAPTQDHPPVQPDGDDIVMEPGKLGSWAPPSPSPMPEVTISRSVSGSIPKTKAGGIGAPQPIRRAVSDAVSYTSDISDASTIEKPSFDLVEKMHYVFVRAVKARSLPTNGSPVIKISLSSVQIKSKPARKTSCFEWDQTFAFLRDAPDSSTVLEISVWDPQLGSDVENFLGGICFDVAEIPLRDPPDSPLAPQWYRLEGGGARMGDLMLATWTGTQADEAFPEAWKTDTAGHVNARAKVYMSPKLWYLRATVIEAQDVFQQLTGMKDASFQIKAQLGFQVQKTKPAISRNGAPTWNEDLLFVAAEPFTEQLVFTLEHRTPKGPATVGIVRVPLTVIERRVDERQVASRWFGFEDPIDEKRGYRSRAHLRLCFDGGYHVMDEAAHICSDYRPTARQLWKPPVGTVELGIIRCHNLLPMKTVDGKGSTDAYAVAKYGPKWIRTRTVSDSLEPKWNEQYTWKVYDPCTVLTVGVFDSWGVYEIDGEKEATRHDLRIGKVRIRISTLETGKAYRNLYPLLMLGTGGVKKMGEMELAVRFVRSAPPLDFLHVYTQSLLPLMHHIKPLGVAQQEMLRNNSMKILAVHLSRSEPPLRPEVVKYMLDADSHGFSMRKVRANWYRIINLAAGLIDVARWMDDTRRWKKPTATILVHALMVMLVWFPDLIIPTLAFYVSVIGAWNYRFRRREPPPHFDPKLSLADAADRDELDEEFDTSATVPRPPEMVRARYERLRNLGARVQTVLGDVAAQGERVQALVTWRDPRASGMFVVLSFAVALLLYLVPTKMIAVATGFYYFRHPIFRDRRPSPVLNFFRRLPSLSDRIM